MAWIFLAEMHAWSRTRHLVQLCLCIKMTFLDASNGTGRHGLGAESGPTCHPAPDTAVLWTLQKVTPAESIKRPQRRQGFGTIQPVSTLAEGCP